MRMYDIIDKKKRGQELTEQEIQYVIEGYVKEEIPDYQVAAWLMAIFFHGLSDHELVKMTEYMAKSGDMVDLSKIQGIKVDKHSTGGVGDKTTLVIAPIVAACGGKVAKMSGRGLGFTGGTIDKLESIPGFRTAIDDKEFYDIVNRTGLAVIGQSGEIAPADKKLYALRDVTATVDSIPLIARELFSLSNEYKNELLVAQTFVYNKAREDVGSGKNFNNKYLKNKRVRYLYEYDDRANLIICRVLEDMYKKEIKDNEEFDRLIYKAAFDLNGNMVTSMNLYLSDDTYGSGEDYRLHDTYSFSYSSGLLTKVSCKTLNLEYQYSGENVISVRYTDGERTYEYNSDGFLKRIDFGNGEYMEIKYEAGHGDFHLFTPLIENSFNLPSIL